MTTKARSKATAYPEEDRVATPEGVLCFVYMREDRILGVCGKDVGWFHLDGAPYYVAANFVRGGDGAWTLDPKQHCVRGLDGGKAGEDAPPAVRTAALERLTAAFHAWRAARPDRAAAIALCTANAALFRVEDEITELEKRLAALRAKVPRLTAARDTAKATVTRAKRAVRRAVKAAAASS